MSEIRERHWQDATGCSTPAEAKRLLLEMDERIKVLADALETAKRREFAVDAACEQAMSALRLGERLP